MNNIQIDKEEYKELLKLIDVSLLDKNIKDRNKLLKIRKKFLKELY